MNKQRFNIGERFTLLETAYDFAEERRGRVYIVDRIGVGYPEWTLESYSLDGNDYVSPDDNEVEYINVGWWKPKWHRIKYNLWLWFWL